MLSGSAESRIWTGVIQIGLAPGVGSQVRET